MRFSAQDPDPPERSTRLSDTELVVRTQAGDQTTFEELAKRHYNEIYLYLVRMVGDHTVAEELAQEVFLKAWIALPRLQKAKAFVSWLYSIAKHLALDYWRATKRTHREANEKSTEEIGTPGPEEEVEARDHLKWALSRIRKEYRRCLILYHIHQRSVPEIAEQLKLKEGTVKTYISNGLKELRHLLSEADMPREGKRD